MNAFATPFEKPELRPVDLALIALMQRQFTHATKAQTELAGLISHQLASGNLCLPLNELETQANTLGICQAGMTELVEQNPLVSTNGSTPLVRDQDALFLHRYWQLEVNISTHITQRLAQPTAADSNIKPFLDTLFTAQDEAELNGETNWQKVACALAGRQRFGIITGGPGTGKTTTVVKLLALHQLIAQANNSALTIRLAAPTGKAAARLAESIANAFERLKKAGVEQSIIDTLPAEAITLHRLLGTQPHTRHYRHNAKNPIQADLVVVDEASMIDIDMMEALLNALPEHCALVLVGDKDQLESVEAGAIMGDLCQNAGLLTYTSNTLSFLQQAGCTLTNNLPANEQGSALAQATVQLKKSWRAQNAKHILDLAAAINDKQPKAANDVFNHCAPNQLLRTQHTEHNAPTDWIKTHLIDGERGLATLIKNIHHNRPDESAGDDAIVDWAKNALKQLGKQQLLSPLRQGPAGVIALNQIIKKALQQHKLLDTPAYNSLPFVEGEPVLVTQNRYDLGVMNGDLGLALKHPALGLRIAFEDKNKKSGSAIRWILPEHLIDYSQGGFAITVHQSQGSEYENVLLYLPDHHNPVISKELLYTAVTRASQQFVLLESDPTVFASGATQSSQRQTRLAQRLA